MTKDRTDRKKEKKEKREKKERKEKKRREAEELEVREKKISKKHKSETKKAEKPEKSKKKSKKSEVEEKSPKKSKESKKKYKRSDESEEPQTQLVDSHPVKVPIATTNNESDSDFEFDKEDMKHLLESYSKEELVYLIYKTAEKGSRLISAVFESADRDSAQRNLFVRGLGWDTTQENLKAAFEVYGEIEECSVVMDKDTGRAKGYGFVLFKTRKGAREALRNPEKRMYNRTVSCNLAAKPSGAGKPREPVESVKIDLTQTAKQSEMALPGLDLAHGHVRGLENGHQQQQHMPMYAGQNMPFYGHSQPPGFNPMYVALMGNQGAMMGTQGAMMGTQGAMMGNQLVPGLPDYRMFGSGMMNQQGPLVPPNPMGMAGQYVGDSNGNGNGNGVGPFFDGERAWYLDKRHQVV